MTTLLSLPLLSCLFFLSLSLFFSPSPLSSQYGFYLPDSYYVDHSNDNPNPYNTWQNATQQDEDLSNFETQIITPTLVKLRRGGFTVGGIFDYQNYIRYDIDGEGTFWNEVSGIGGVWIDLRPGQYTDDQLATVGVVKNSNGTVSYTLSYINQLTEFQTIHNHGQLGPYWTDGTPYISQSPMAPGATWNITYTIDPTINSGTYFIHGHYGFGSTKGLSAPLIVQYSAPSGYPSPWAQMINDVNTQEVLLYLEDWCLVYTNADDYDTAGDNYTDYHSIQDPSICENPELAFRSVWGEWNSNKGSDYLGPPLANGISNGKNSAASQSSQELYQCDAPVVALEYGFSYFFANDRTYDNPQMIQLVAGGNVRLRIINAGRMTSFKIVFPPNINATVIATDGHYTQPHTLGNGGSLWAGSAMRFDVLFTLPLTPGSFPIVAYEEAPAFNANDPPGFQQFEVSHTAGIIIYTTATVPSNPPIINATVPGIGMLSMHPEYIVQQEGSLQAFTTESVGFTHQSPGIKVIQLAASGYNGIYGWDFQPGMQMPPLIPYSTFINNVNTNTFMPTPINVNLHDQICINFTSYNRDTHPIHLHGHRFQVTEINGQVVNGPVRDTFYLPGSSCHNVVICLNADNAGLGAHALHCHMVVHELSGMSKLLTYNNYNSFFPDGQALSTVVVDTSSDDGRATMVGAAVGVLLGVALLISLIGNWVLYQKVKIYSPVNSGGESGRGRIMASDRESESVQM